MRSPENCTILVVDDEAALRKALAFDFKRKGFRVLEASSGDEAFELVKSAEIDLILTDIRMPNGDGVSLLKRTKDLNHRLPIVMFITGFADLSRESAYDQGADAIFSKPFDRKELMSTITDALAQDPEPWSRTPERFEVDAKIEVKLEGLEVAIAGRALNIGRGGMFVALTEALPAVGAVTSFKIAFATGEILAIEGQGIVRWNRRKGAERLPAGCGIEFTYLNETTRRAVVKILQTLNRRAYIPRV